MESMNHAQNLFEAQCVRNSSPVQHALVLDHSQCARNHKPAHSTQNAYHNGYRDLYDPQKALDSPIDLKVDPKNALLCGKDHL